MSQTAQLRLTRSGTGLAVGVVVLAAVAAISGYREFLLLAAVGALALIVAMISPRVSSPMTLKRFDVPKFVARGADVSISLSASAQRPIPPTRVLDQLADFSIPINLPHLSAKKSTVARYTIQARRRGVHQIGPLLEERTDPLALATRSVSHAVMNEIFVHPVVHRLRLPEGFSQARQARATTPRFSEDPLADFRSLREYVVGDDARLVHWASTAKTGALMVRDHFELRRTTRCVVLETLDTSADEGAFEEAVEIAVSIVCESLEQNIQVVARTRDHDSPGKATPIRHREDALELFTRVNRSSEEMTLPPAQLRVTGDRFDQVFLVGGANSPLVRHLVGASWASGRLTIIRIHHGSGTAPKLPVRTVDVSNAEQFVAQWNAGKVVV
jgi:uncharacterized protein (DUF58 family)